VKFLENRTLTHMGEECTVLKVLCRREVFRISFSLMQHLNSGVGGLTVEASRSLSLSHTHTYTHTHTHGRTHPNDSSSLLYDLVIDGWSQTEKRTYRCPFPL